MTAAVERACVVLTERGLVRDGCALRFELKPRAGPGDPKNP